MIPSLILILGEIAAPIAPIVSEQPQIQSIALYYKPDCPDSKKVLSYLKSQNLTIPLKNVMRDQEAKKELIRVGGHAIVPCLIVDGRAIYNYNDIIQWLKENSGILPKS